MSVLMKQFVGKIRQDSTHSETEWEFIFDGKCSACGMSIGQLLRVCKKDWGDVVPSDEEIDEAIKGALVKNHKCSMAVTNGGLIVARA